MSLIKSFTQISKTDTLIAGGKGASLGEMTQAGIPVPKGFVILSNAFDKFIKKTDLNVEIDAALDEVNINEVHTVENASEKIKAMILSKEMPEDIKKEVLKNYKKLDAKFVAVRSSATSEDSASAAWAGQLETYLNTTKENLLENVKKCWASLFTPRAIFYRFEKKLSKEKISVAVVVQKMIDSEESGIAFSVHPVTQDENQIIIEAGFGLGESIVSGSITPDSYVIDKQGFNILDINITEQTKALYKKSKGGNEWKELAGKGKKQVLNEKEIIELSKLIVKIETHYGFPCDIEWAKEKGKFYIVQSRPITTIKVKKIKAFDIQQRIITPKNLSVFEIDENSNYFSVVARKSVLLLRCCLPWGYCDNERYIKLFGFPTPHKPFYDSRRGIFVDRNAIAVEKKEILSQIEKKSDYLKTIADKLQDDGDKLWKQSLKIKKTDLNKKTDEELKELARKGIEDIVNLCAYLLFPLSLQGYFEESIKKWISQKIKDQKLKDEYFKVLTTPSKQNFGYFEQVAILKLATLYSENKKIESDIEKYLFDFDTLGVKYGIGELWNTKEVAERIKYLAGQSPKKRLNHILSIPKQADDKVEALLKKLNADQNFKKFIATTRLYIYLRTYRTDIISGAFANMFPLFEEIGKRNALNLKSVIECLPNEITSFEFPNKKTITERAKTNILRGIDGNLYVAFGEKAIKIHKKLLKKVNQKITKTKTKITENKEIKGVIANKGIVKGFVKIVLDNTELKKVNEGDILVSSMTTPDFVPAMEKASAFITDEGGILCHAAIVSREMKKPCIIGTGNATSILKDGDLVEVDAEKGVVKILNKKTKQDKVQNRPIKTSDKKSFSNEVINKFKDYFKYKEITKQEGSLSPLVWETLASSIKIPLYKKYYPKIDFGPIIFMNKENKGIGFFNFNSYLACAEDGLKRYLSGRLEEFNDMKKLRNRITEMYKNYSPEALSKLNGKELINITKEIFLILQEAQIITLFCEALDDKVVKKYFDRFNKSQKISLEEFFNIASLVFFNSFFGQLDLALIEFDKKNLYKTQWAFSDYMGTPNVEDIQNKVKQLIKEKGGISKVIEERKELEKEVSENKEKISKFKTKLNSDLRKLFEFIQETIKLRDLRKRAFFNCIALLSNSVRELLKRKEVDKNLFYYVIFSDLKKDLYLKENYIEILKKRKEGNLYYFDEKYFQELNVDYENTKKEIFGFMDRKNGKEIKGVIAQKGFVQGKAKIILDQIQFKEFNEGDVLITSMTRPEFVPLMKQARAIITDEGGLTCHAAIVSRELKIPCIIGTKNATRILNDGDLVEVDANKGIVKILKRK